MTKRPIGQNRSVAPGERGKGVASVVGQGEDGTRVKITDDTPLKAFTITKLGPVWDVHGKKCYPGEEAMLDEITATWMAKRGLLEVEIKFDAKSDKPAKAAKTSGGNKDVSGDGDTAHAITGELDGRSDAAKADAADDKDNDKPSRRRSSGAAPQHKPDL